MEAKGCKEGRKEKEMTKWKEVMKSVLKAKEKKTKCWRNDKKWEESKKC